VADHDSGNDAAPPDDAAGFAVGGLASGPPAAAAGPAEGDQGRDDASAAPPALPFDDLKAVVEALIFASPDPLTPKALHTLLDGDAAPEHVDAAVEAVKHDYERAGGLQLVEVAGGLQIVTRPERHEWVRRLFHEQKAQKLSVQALETLAVIAYKQPVTAAEIGEIRGVNSSGVLGTLIDRKLIKIVGRKSVVGRPFMYGTTNEFLNRFGLRDLNDLPRVEDMADALGFQPSLLNDSSVEVGLPFDGSDQAESPEPSGAAPVDDESAPALLLARDAGGGDEPADA
jgi:segregation and condensation protein B